MGDMKNPPGNRQRAPTITIDTSATDISTADTSAANTSSAPAMPMNPSPTSSQGDRISHSPVQTAPSIPQFPSPSNFLSVPGGADRSRQDSFDSNTYVASDAGSPHSPLDEQDPLKPDPGTEEDFVADDNKFAFTPGQLAKLFNPKSLAAFYALGGVEGLRKGLRTDLQAGLSPDEHILDGLVSFQDATGQKAPEYQYSVSVETGKGGKGRRRKEKKEKKDKAALPRLPPPKPDAPFFDRIRIFSDNHLPARKPKNIFQLMWMAYNDKVLILLTIAAIVSLAIGIPQSLQEDPPGLEWVEGVAICVAIIIVVVVGAINDFQKENQFVKLNKKKEDRSIKVIRSGTVQQISIYDCLVGDIALLETGDMIPVDGIFLEGSAVKCDESSATGESDLLKKTPAREVMQALESGASTRKMDPFILSGAKVSEGIGRFLVTAVGVHSGHGKTMMSLRDDPEVTPLQSKLNVLAEYIAKLGGAAALLYFVVAFIEFLVRITSGADQALSGPDKGQQFLQIFILAVSVIVVAVPEGLPLAVTLALAFATTRMLKDNNLVRLLRSCETMGNATTVCSDKTGTLTQNKMSVVAGTLGTASRFGDRKGLQLDPSAMAKESGHGKNELKSSAPGSHADDVSANECISSLCADAKFLLLQSIAINSTAFEGEEEGKKAFIGSKTETALLSFAEEHLAMQSVSTERANAESVQFIPFDSGRKCMAAVVKLANNRYRMYVKGASEILLAKSSKLVDTPTTSLHTADLDRGTRETLQRIISSYASRSLRTIALIYKDYEQWPPAGARKMEDDASQVNFDDIFRNMTFFGVVGIQDPLRPGVPEAVQDFKRAGVFVRMVTGDNVQTAKAIATECGIYTEGGIVMEGPDFRKLSRTEMDEIIPRLQVLARSSPDDKRRLVKRLKELGETVAVTGDGTNDAPALKTADVGFSMGVAGTEVAKEASAIILMDDNFSSIVKALMWGRAVNDAVKKFLQFQITVNITAVVTTFVTGVSNSSGSSVLTAVQLLWVNLIMDTMAALALATDPPSRSILDRKPDRKSAPLISVTMWKMIIGQAIYQLVVVFVLFYRGHDILNQTVGTHDYDALGTLIFNTFVWMQIFNALNSRRLDNKFNVFEGVHHNWLFIGIFAIMVGVQVMIIFVGGAALNVISNPTLGADYWGISVVLGALSIPIGVVIRLIPDEFCRALVPNFLKKRGAPRVAVEDEEAQRFEWNPAISDVRDQLLWLKRFKGGRLNQLTFAVRHPRESGIFSGRPSSAFTRSRSSTNVTGPPTPNGELANDQKHSLQVERPTTPLQQSGDNSRSTTPDPSRKPRSRRGRSHSGSGFGPSIVAAGIVAGSIGGWSPVERPPGSGELPPPSRDRSRSNSNIDERLSTHDAASTSAQQEAGKSTTT